MDRRLEKASSCAVTAGCGRGLRAGGGARGLEFARGVCAGAGWERKSNVGGGGRGLELAGGVCEGGGVGEGAADQFRSSRSSIGGEGGGVGGGRGSEREWTLLQRGTAHSGTPIT